MRRILLPLLVLLTLASIARADDWTLVEEHWYELLIAGGKAGWLHESVYSDDSRYRTVMESAMTFGRGAAKLEVSTESAIVETHEGEALEVTYVQNMSANEVTQHWEFRDKDVLQTTRQGGTETTKELPLPEGVWLTPQAVNRFFDERREAGAKEIQYRMLNPENGLQPVAVKSTFVEESTYDFEGHAIPVTVWRSVTDLLPGMASTEKVSGDGDVVYSEMNMGIGMLVTRLVSRKDAMAEGDNQVPELLFKTCIESDPIDNVMEATHARLELRTREGDLPELPSAGAQLVEPGEDSSTAILTVNLEQPQPATEEEIASPEYLDTSAMVNAEDALVVKLAHKAVRDVSDDPAARAAALRTFVYDHITRKGLETAFASASETARTRAGDCSEHGVLLCAMLRAQGIPARVATGLVYVEQFAGMEHVFGWHMWTQALIDGKWVDYDATLPVQHHVGHVLTGTSSLADGAGSAEMANVMLLIGNLDIKVLEVNGEKSKSQKIKTEE